MATLKKTVNETYYWSLDRVYELCSRDDSEEIVNGDALRQEFEEWIVSYNKNSDEEISMRWSSYFDTSWQHCL